MSIGRQASHAGKVVVHLHPGLETLCKMQKWFGGFAAWGGCEEALEKKKRGRADGLFKCPKEAAGAPYT